MKERMKLFVAWEEGESVSELARRFGISRKTAYKWIARASERDGLRDRSSRPGRTPHKTPESVERIVVAARKRHPRWGPKKLPRVMRMIDPDVAIPAPSTINAILKRNGLIVPRRRRRRGPSAPSPLTEYGAVNNVWCIDFKGDFRVGAKRCYPLTVMDGASRFLIACQSMSRIRTQTVKKALRRAFAEFGLPTIIRTDNGAPFASRGAGGLSKLSVWWINLGITPERIEPGKPQQNGRLERFHRTLKDETARPPAATLSAQQRRFDKFRAEYNELRPHESLDQRPPAEFYEPSTRILTRDESLPRYPLHVESYRTDRNGCIQWRGRRLRLNSCLDQQLVEVRKVADAHYDVYFGPARLGRFTKPNSKTKTIKLDTSLEVLPGLPV